MRLLRTGMVLALPLFFVSAGIWLLFREGQAGEGPKPASPAAPVPVLPDQDPEEELRFAPNEIDLGSVKEGPLHCVFEYQNRSPRVVRLLRVVPSCNCSITRPDKDAIQPGESGHIAVDVTPRGKPVGRQAYAFTVEYESAVPRQARLLVRATHTPDVVVPESVTLRSVPGCQASTAFTLVDYRERPLDLTAITTSSPDLKVSIERRPGSYLPGWQYELRATFASDRLPPGESIESIFLDTGEIGHGLSGRITEQLNRGAAEKRSRE